MIGSQESVVSVSHTEGAGIRDKACVLSRKEIEMAVVKALKETVIQR